MDLNKINELIQVIRNKIEKNDEQITFNIGYETFIKKETLVTKYIPYHKKVE